MRLKEIIENDKLIRMLMEDNMSNEKLRTTDPKRIEQRIDFMRRLMQMARMMEKEWKGKA